MTADPDGVAVAAGTAVAMGEGAICAQAARSVHAASAPSRTQDGNIVDRVPARPPLYGELWITRGCNVEKLPTRAMTPR